MPDLITVRGAFRYTTRDSLEDAMWQVRLLLDERPPPLRFRCWVTARNTLSIEIAVPMFGDDDVAPTVCETLGATSISARCVVRAQKTRFADGTGSERALPQDPLDLAVDDLIATISSSS